MTNDELLSDMKQDRNRDPWLYTFQFTLKFFLFCSILPIWPAAAIGKVCSTLFPMPFWLTLYAFINQLFDSSISKSSLIKFYESNFYVFCVVIAMGLVIGRWRCRKS